MRLTLRGLAVGMLVPTVALAVALALTRGIHRPGGLLLFAALMLYSEARAIPVTERVAVSTAPLIGTAAIVAFYPRGDLLAMLLVGVTSGVELPIIRARRWDLVALNAATGGLAILAAGATYEAFANRAGSHFPNMALAAMGATAVYLLANAVIFGGGSHVTGRAGFGEVVTEMTPSWLQQVPFTLLGFFVGLLYVSLGAGVMLLIVVPILIAREMFASYLRVKESHDETVHMLIRALEVKDRYTAGHAERVANYAQYMGEQMNFGPARMERLRFAALMHDIGKLVVPNHLLNKPGRLTESEFARIRIHEKVSVQMLSHIDFLRPIAAASHSDSTTFDPDDLDHPIEPYMVMIADAYDAMTSTRSYRKALPQEVAFAELRDKAGIQFHPACVEALITAVEARGEKHGAGYEKQAEFLDAPAAGLGSAGLGDLLPAEA
ncbi:MAG: HD domain-containing phosphohydrolase [Actinomycetota bacterium]